MLPLAYAPYSTQFRTELRGYKNPGPPLARARALRTLQALMWSFSYFHESCLDAVSSSAPGAVVVVPSGTIRRDTHPFEHVAKFAPAQWKRVEALRTYEIGRECDPDSIEFRGAEHLSGRHLVVLDDAWTTGSKAEGVAMAARREGATEVTVIPVGRIVNTNYPPAEALMQRLSGTPWSPNVCPVTGENCLTS